jgi:hypothetical protein
MQDQSFDAAGAAGGIAGSCVYAAPLTGQTPGIDSRTCTGSSGYCVSNNHPSVAVAPEIGVQLKTVTAGAAASTHALLGSTVIRDANAAVPTTVQAQDSDQRLLVAQ